MNLDTQTTTTVSPPNQAESPPRTGVELIRATAKFAREQRGRSWLHLWTTFAVLIVALVLTALPFFLPIRLALGCIAGLVVVRMFIIYHDFNHGTILRGSRLAKWIMFVYGVMTLNPPSSWKRSHNHHHKNNAKVFGASIGSFPVMTTEGYAKESKRVRFFYAMARHPLTILFGYWTVFLYGMSLRPFLKDPAKHVDCAIAFAFQLILITTLAIFAPSVLLTTLLMPMIVASALGAYLFYSQHNFPGVKLPERADWDFVEAALKSSSYTKMGPVLSWFTGNIGYHHVHHLNAHIPFYRLPEAMRAIRELQNATTIRLNLRDAYRCFRLKLWDPQLDKMVSFKGV